MVDRKVRYKIERSFKDYAKNRQRGAEYIVELAESGLIAQYGKVGSGNNVGNPTEAKAIKAAGDIAALWCKVVENTLITFKWEIEEWIIDMYYFRKLSRAEICDELGIAERTFTYATSRIVERAFMWAAEYGLIP